MPRYFTSGCETQRVPGTTFQEDAEAGGVVSKVGTSTYNLLAFRSGSACWSFGASASNLHAISIIGANGTTFFARIPFRIGTSLPSATLQFARCNDNGGVSAQKWALRISTAGAASLVDSANALVGTASAALSINTWYVAEVTWKDVASGNGQLGWHLYKDSDGTLLKDVAASAQSITNSTTLELRLGHITAAETATSIQIDDVAINTDSGTSGQESWPGWNGKVVHLWPASDNSVGTGWAEADGTTNSLFADVNHTPPIGTVTASATNNEQIKNSTASASVLYYAANMDSYTTAGISANATINTVCAGVRTAGSSTTGTNDARFSITSNPAEGGDTTLTGGFDSVAAAESGTTPAWQTGLSPYTYFPSVTLGTQPVLRVGKNANTTRIHQVDQMWIQVDYIYNPTTVTLATAAATSTTTLALSAPGIVTLATAASTSATTLAITAPTQIPLATAAAVSSTSDITIYTTGNVIQETASATSTASLNLTAPTQVALDTATSTSTTSLALTSKTFVALGTAAATSTTSNMDIVIPAFIPLDTAASTSTTSLSLSAKTTISLETASAVSTTSLSLKAKTTIPLDTASAVSTTSLSLSAQTEVPLDTAVATSSTSLTLRVPTIIALQTAVATSTATMTVSTVAHLLLETASATSTTSLALRAKTFITLQTAVAVSTTSLHVAVRSKGFDNPGLIVPVTINGLSLSTSTQKLTSVSSIMGIHQTSVTNNLTIVERVNTIEE